MLQESNRFTIYLHQLSPLLKAAEGEKSPSNWLNKHNARGSLFMLEALSKIYSETLDKKLFEKLNNYFKDFEDGLGKIDYYLSLEEDLRPNQNIQPKYLQYFKDKAEKTSENLNEILTDHDWISKDNLRINKIIKKLSKNEWMNSADEIESISGYYKSEINKINDFVNKTKFHFADIENDVHELRRKIRWLSIYPQALQGVFQFDDKIITAPHLNKYLIPEIINSPFNQLPESANNKNKILLNKNYFLALSWMISELGKLKDQGLNLSGLIEAMKETDSIKDDEAMSKAHALLGKSQKTMPEILEQAESISKTFFKENNLEFLLAQ